jgi:hypothetical protein
MKAGIGHRDSTALYLDATLTQEHRKQGSVVKPAYLRYSLQSVSQDL